MLVSLPLVESTSSLGFGGAELKTTGAVVVVVYFVDRDFVGIDGVTEVEDVVLTLCPTSKVWGLTKTGFCCSALSSGRCSSSGSSSCWTYPSFGSAVVVLSGANSRRKMVVYLTVRRSKLLISCSELLSSLVFSFLGGILVALIIC